MLASPEVGCRVLGAVDPSGAGGKAAAAGPPPNREGDTQRSDGAKAQATDDPDQRRGRGGDESPRRVGEHWRPTELPTATATIAGWGIVSHVEAVSCPLHEPPPSPPPQPPPRTVFQSTHTFHSRDARTWYIGTPGHRSITLGAVSILQLHGWLETRGGV